MVMPGDNPKFTPEVHPRSSTPKFNVELIAPIAMQETLRVAIREGGHTVGAGVVSKILA